LQDASTNVQSVVGEIARIAKQTRILSINASIEASRAGEQGRAFNVVAQEVQQLADQTHGSTAAIQEKVHAIQGSVRYLASAVVEKPGTGSSVITVHAVNAEVQAMASTAGRQRDDARSLHGLGEQANHLTEELLLAVGEFRLGVHRKAAKEVSELLVTVINNFNDRPHLESALLTWLHSHPGFELLYITNSEGRQITDNIGWKSDQTVLDATGYNKDWRDRPWFRNAKVQMADVSISDIYRSAATGDFCFTVSSIVPDGKGHALGVLGADVNFQRLLTGDLQR
jgi:methyl-accepting chemotaxis protein